MSEDFLRQSVWPRLPRSVQGALFRRRLRSASGRRDLSARVFDYDRARLPNPYLARLEEGVADLEQAVAVSGMSIGYPAWNLLYFAVFSSLPARPSVVVETGTNNGVSTIVLAQALADRGQDEVVRTVDIDPVVVESARRNVDAAGLTPHVDFTVGDSVDFLTGLEVDHVDFAFLDGSHQKDMVLREFAVVHPLVVAGQGSVYFDNTTSGGVAAALTEIKARYGGNIVEFRSCSWLPPGNAIWQP